MKIKVEPVELVVTLRLNQTEIELLAARAELAHESFEGTEDLNVMKELADGLQKALVLP
jgi:hypothetical protein